MSIFASALRHAVTPAAPHRRFAGAGGGSTLADWTTPATSADTALRGSFRKLLDRCRDLERDNDYMRGFLGDCEDNIVGAVRFDLRSDAGEYVRSGAGVVWQPDNLAIALIEDGWREWSKVGTCTVCGKHEWRDVKRLAARVLARDGNFLVRKIRGDAAGNRFKFALQLLEIDHLELDLFRVLPNGGEIRFGVETDAHRRPVAYYLRTRHPGDYAGGSVKVERIPASEIYHLHLSERTEQTIGVPWAVSAIRRLRQLGGFEEAAVIAARVGAMQSGFFKKTVGPGGSVGTWTGETDVDGNGVMDAQPGTFTELPEGWDLAAWNPQYPDVDTGAFRKAMLMGVATGLRTSYITLGNDLEAVNYSSARVGIFDERETWMSHQVFIDAHFNELVFADWLETAILSGAVRLPLSKFAKFNRPIFKARRWAYIDPVKEMAAAREALNLRLTSRRRLVEQAGGDFEDVLSETAEDAALAKKYGVTLPDGGASPAPAAPPPDDDEPAKPGRPAKE